MLALMLGNAPAQLTAQVVLFLGLLLAPACSKETNISSGGSNGGGQTAQLPDCSRDEPSPGDHGPAMVRVSRLDGTCLWIDETEVTRGQYQAFLDSNPEVQTESPCTWNESYLPSCSPLSADGGDDGGASDDSECPQTEQHPIVCVDWCDAQAFCRWAGKQLCKGEFDAPADAFTSSWYSPCSHGDQADFPYGDSYDEKTCFGNDFSEPAPSCPRPVGELGSCATPDGVFDMSGNVAEWVDECRNPGTDNGECKYRGGHYASPASDMACAQTHSEKVVPRMDGTTLVGRRPFLGFRCCAYD